MPRALGALALIGCAAAAAQTKEVTIAHQDMLDPYRIVMESGELEKATGYKINWRMFGGGGDVIRAMASGDVQIGEAGSSPIAAAASQGQDIKLFWILVMLDMNVKAYLVDQDAGVTFQASSMYKLPDATGAVATSGRLIGQFSLHLVCLALVENVVYFASVFAVIWLDPFRRHWRAKLLADDQDAPGTKCSSALCIASFGKLFALMTVIWEVHWSFVHVIGALVVVSNVLALQLLLGEQDPAQATSLHVVAVVVLGLAAKFAAQLALYAMGNSVLFHVLV